MITVTKLPILLYLSRRILTNLLSIPGGPHHPCHNPNTNTIYWYFHHLPGYSSLCTAADRCLPRLEALTMKAELFEQTGNFEKCLTYMSDAKALAKSISQTMVNLVAVQYIRIWHRLRSDRLTSAVSDLVSGCEYDSGMGMNGGVGLEYSAEKNHDDVSKLILKAAKCLQCMESIRYVFSSSFSPHSSTTSSLPSSLLF